MAEYTRDLRWRQWAGTVEPLIEAAELSARTLNGDQIKVVLSIADVTVTLDSLEELSTGPIERELGRVDSLSLTVGHPYSAVGVSVEGSPSRGLVVRVSDTDHTRFEGLTQQLGATLRPRERVSVGESLREWWWGLAVGTWFVAWIGTPALLRANTTLRAPTTLALGVAASLLVAGLFVFGWWISPPFELLQPGERCRFGRWRGRLVASVGVVLLGIASSVAAAVIYG